jgi:tetratricopeptide (TPR) repeat protein
VDIGYGSQYLQDLTSDVEGKFRTEYTLDGSTFKSLSVKLVVNREGFHQAREFVDFGSSDKTWGIDVVMRPDASEADDLPVGTLVNQLVSKLRIELPANAPLAAAKKDFEQGVSQFLDEHDSAKAIPNFNKVVKRCPDCAECRLILGLALLDAGSWSGATRESAQAAKMISATGSASARVDSYLVLAAMENWKGEYAKAAGLLVQAKDLDPKNAFVLQELGRTLILQKNWEAADDYLAKAIGAGASKEALLLRTRALLEEGDPEAADAAMKEYLGDGNIQSSPVRVRGLYSEIQVRMNLHATGRVKSFVSEPLSSLLRAMPELQGMEPAASQTELAAILQKTGDGVQAFFDNFQNTVSTEQISEKRLGKDGKIKDSLDQKFRYLLVTHPQKQRLGLEEFRTNLHGDRTEPTGLSSGLMLSSGFATTSLLFHPAYQAGSTFRYLGRQVANGRECHVVAFAETPEKAQMIERFSTADDSVLILFQGLAWIDAQNYKILRLRTDLLQPQSKIRLQRQTTEISYDPVQFKQVAFAMWLPSEVAVTVEWRGRTFRNMHKYSEFKLFNIETKDKVRPTEIPPEGPPPDQP